MAIASAPVTTAGRVGLCEVPDTPARPLLVPPLVQGPLGIVAIQNVGSRQPRRGQKRTQVAKRFSSSLALGFPENLARPAHGPGRQQSNQSTRTNELGEHADVVDL